MASIKKSKNGKWKICFEVSSFFFSTKNETNCLSFSRSLSPLLLLTPPPGHGVVDPVQDPAGAEHLLLDSVPPSKVLLDRQQLLHSREVSRLLDPHHGTETGVVELLLRLGREAVLHKGPGGVDGRLAGVRRPPPKVAIYRRHRHLDFDVGRRDDVRKRRYLAGLVRGNDLVLVVEEGVAFLN